jgi:hypothetical protein
MKNKIRKSDSVNQMNYINKLKKQGWKIYHPGCLPVPVIEEMKKLKEKLMLSYKIEALQDLKNSLDV